MADRPHAPRAGPGRWRSPPVAATPEWMQRIPVTHLHVKLAPTRAWSVPDDLDHVVRGALTAAFSGVVCARPPRDCKRCELLEACLVPGWFEPHVRPGGSNEARVFAPVAHHPGQDELGPGEPWTFELWLFGRVPSPASLTVALVRMARHGLGRVHVPQQVVSVKVRGTGRVRTVLRQDEEADAWPAPATLAEVAPWPEDLGGAIVHLRTPVQFDDPALASGELTPPSPSKAVLRMIQRIRNFTRALDVRLDTRLPGAPDGAGAWEAIEPVEGWRHGRTPRGPVPRYELSGFLGRLRFGPEVAEFAPVLAAAQVIGVGRHTAEGLGRVEVEWLSARDR